MHSIEDIPVHLDALLAGRDDAPALIVDHSIVSRGRLRAAARGAARHLASLGLARGDALAVWLPNGPAWLQLLFAAAELGVLVVPISTRYKAPEVKHLLTVSRAKAIVTPREFLGTAYAEIARSLLPEVATLSQVLEVTDVGALLPWDGQPVPPRGGDALLCCFSTSGTTGMPKLATHGEASIARHAHCVARALAIGPQSSVLCVLPLFGVFGFMTVLAAFAGGAACVLRQVFETEDAADAIARHRVTHMIGADTMFDALFNLEGADLASLTRAVQADFVGLSLSVTQRGAASGIAFTGTYGSSECYSLMSFAAPGAPIEVAARAGGVLADPAIAVRVVDPESGHEVPEGERGELQFKGPNVLAGYLNNPEATAKAMTSDGWFRSGDLGYREGMAFVYLARMGDSLRLRGYLVNPAEIEACLMQHPSVGGAQVVGVRRPGEGDIAVAYVIRGAGEPDEATLLAHCRARIASYKLPRHVVTIDAFPAINGPNGNKIQKRVLRDMAQALIEADATHRQETA